MHLVLWVLLVLRMLHRQLMQPSSLPISMEQRPAKAITVKWWRNQRKEEKASSSSTGRPAVPQGNPSPRIAYALRPLVLGISFSGLSSSCLALASAWELAVESLATCGSRSVSQSPTCFSFVRSMGESMPTVTTVTGLT